MMMLITEHRPMAPKFHPTTLSGGDRKVLKKKLVRARAMAGILVELSEEKRRVGEALIREADTLAVAIFPAEPESASTGSGFAFCAIQECYCLLGSSSGLT
jgi:hypothetical protein